MNKTARILLTALFCLLPLCGYGQGGNNKESEYSRAIARHNRDLELLNDQIRKNEKEKGSVATKLELIKAAVNSRRALVAESDREITRYGDSIRIKNSRIKTLQTRLDTLTSYYARLVRNAYKNRDPRVWYLYILASDDIAQAFRRIGFLKSLSSQMATQARKIRTAKDELEVQKKAVLQLRSQAEAVRTQRRAELKKLKDDETKAEQLLAQINKNGKKYKKEADAKKAELERLEKELKRLRETIAKKGSSSTTTSNKTEADQALASQFKKNQGKLPWPIDGPVTGKFGSYSHPLHKNVYSLKNQGINIAAKNGEEVKAIFGGTVLQVFEIRGYGYSVAVNHGSYTSLYCRIKDIPVKAGDKVETGQALGKVVTIGGETYLHFELWNLDGSPVNPEVWLK